MALICAMLQLQNNWMSRFARYRSVWSLPKYTQYHGHNRSAFSDCGALGLLDVALQSTTPSLRIGDNCSKLWACWSINQSTGASLAMLAERMKSID
jgi:hypothetical protein